MSDNDLRELDRQIAKRVFGLHYPALPGQREEDWQFAHWSDGRQLRMYSSLIQDAWLVVEAMEDAGWSWVLYSHDGGYMASLLHFTRRGPTMPNAICSVAIASLDNVK